MSSPEKISLVKNQISEADITGLTSDGAGVARIDGAVVFVPGAVPGDRCDIRIVKASAGASYGRIERLISASPDRCEPDCPVFPKCGGCSFRNMSYEAELRHKVERVCDTLKRIGGVDIPCESIIAADDPDRCRYKAVIPAGIQNASPVCGFYRRHSHDVMAISDCLLQRPEAFKAANAVMEYARLHDIPIYDELSGKGLIRRVFVRVSAVNGSCFVCIISAGRIPGAEQLADEVMRACPACVGVLLNINKTRGNAVLGGEFTVLKGQGYITDRLLGLDFRVSPQSFFQVNPPQAEKLYSKALEFADLSSDDRALDLYCGAGTITLLLAKKAGQVIGTEIVPQAAADARENASANNVSNVRFICADAGQTAARLAAEGFHPDVITVDPPRKGMDAEAISAIKAMAPQKLVYISCDPATLARDIALLSPDYTPTRLAVCDMFPRTAHVETVVLMSRAKE